MNLPNQFANREALIAYCRQAFPEATAVSDCVSTTRGGLAAAEERLAIIEPTQYGRTRNEFGGKVTRLSPYLRHGVLDLAETIRRVKGMVGSPHDAFKLLQELAWRDYWRRVLDEIGEDVWADQEEYKTGFASADYADDLPKDFLTASTGNDFVDGTVRELHETGHLHNQSRMKIAAYVVHWRRVKWQAGARWMLSHLLDGDLASNNLSWQWVASTFAAKPYIFNRENLEKVTKGMYTGYDADGTSPFEGSYDELNERLFCSND